MQETGRSGGGCGMTKAGGAVHCGRRRRELWRGLCGVGGGGSEQRKWERAAERAGRGSFWCSARLGE